MAQVIKSGARKPLAINQASYSWGSHFSGLPEDGKYRVRVAGDTHSYNIEMTAKEWLGFLSFYAGHETFDPVPSYAMDKRSLPEKLRALADKLERI